MKASLFYKMLQCANHIPDEPNDDGRIEMTPLCPETAITFERYVTSNTTHKYREEPKIALREGVRNVRKAVLKWRGMQKLCTTHIHVKAALQRGANMAFLKTSSIEFDRLVHRMTSWYHDKYLLCHLESLIGSRPLPGLNSAEYKMSFKFPIVLYGHTCSAVCVFKYSLEDIGGIIVPEVGQIAKGERYRKNLQWEVHPSEGMFKNILHSFRHIFYEFVTRELALDPPNPSHAKAFPDDRLLKARDGTVNFSFNVQISGDNAPLEYEFYCKPEEEVLRDLTLCCHVPTIDQQEPEETYPDKVKILDDPEFQNDMMLKAFERRVTLAAENQYRPPTPKSRAGSKGTRKCSMATSQHGAQDKSKVRRTQQMDEPSTSREPPRPHFATGPTPAPFGQHQGFRYELPAALVAFRNPWHVPPLVVPIVQPQNACNLPPTYEEGETNPFLRPNPILQPNPYASLFGQPGFPMLQRPRFPHTPPMFYPPVFNPYLGAPRHPLSQQHRPTFQRMPCSVGQMRPANTMEGERPHVDQEQHQQRNTPPIVQEPSQDQGERPADNEDLSDNGENGHESDIDVTG